MITKVETAGLYTLAAALAALLSSPVAAPNLKVEPGRYIVTVTYQVQDQRQNEPRVTTRCITGQDLLNPERIFSDQTGSTQGNGEVCSVRNLESGDRNVSYEADCPNRTVHVAGHWSSEGFLVVRTVIPSGNQGVPLKLAVRGTRTGDCPAHGD